MDRTSDFDLMKHNLTDVIKFTKIIIGYDGFNPTTDFWQPLVTTYFKLIDLPTDQFREQKRLQHEIEGFLEKHEIVKWVNVSSNQTMLQIDSNLSEPQRAFLNQLLLLTYFTNDSRKKNY